MAKLQEYVGTYQDEPGRPIEIVLGQGLLAVQDEAGYRLDATGVDEFTAAAGGKISFQRDPTGRVSGLTLDGTPHLRQSSGITAASAALARARPPGKDQPEDYRYRVPPDRHDGIAVGDIATSDLGVATARAIVSGVLDGTYHDVHSVLLYQRGKLVLEEYFYGYGPGRPHQLRSATKSIVSALAGIAIDQGAIASVDAPVLPFLSYTDYLNPDPRKSEITLAQVLSMSSGLACNDHSSDSPGRETVIDEAPDWVKATLDLPLIAAPGVHGYYCSGGVAVVGRVVENAVHRYLPDFAQARLFGPLGIARNEWSWNYTLTNANKEYSQIHLRPRAMLKIGLLYADGGRWHGRQVISSSWVRASLAEHSQVDDTAYGYFWWHPWINVTAGGIAQRIDYNAAQGNGGQKIYLVPQFDLVAVFTAGAYNAASAPPNKIMSTIILPALIAARAHGGPAAAPEQAQIHGREGAVLAADLYGSGTRGVVLAHGGRLTKADWAPQAAVLAAHGFHVLAFDFRGFGASPAPPPGENADDAARDDVLAAVRYLHEHGAQTVAVVGASFGGTAAADAAGESAPGEIDRVVLLAHGSSSHPELIKGDKLFIVCRGDTDGEGTVRLTTMRADYRKALPPKRFVVLDCSAHAQFAFRTSQGPRLLREILRFLSAPAH